MATVAWTAAEAETAREKWLLGWSAGQIGTMLNRSRNSVIGFIHRMQDKDETVKRPRPTRVRTPKSPKPRVTNRIDRLQFVEFLNEPEGGVTLLDLKNFQCRWIKDNTGGGIHTIYCGAPAFETSSWCPYHFNIAVIKHTDREKRADLRSFGKARAAVAYRSHQK
jgi:hypothetical protein